MLELEKQTSTLKYKTMIAMVQKKPIMEDSRLVYALNLFSKVKTKSDITAPFDSFFNGCQKTEHSIEDAAHNAVVLTYFNKIGGNKDSCATVFNLEKSLLEKIISQHQDRFRSLQSTYYRLFLRVLGEVEIPIGTKVTLRKVKTGKGFSLNEEQRKKAEEMIGIIATKMSCSFDDIISESREGALPICRILFAVIFRKLYPKASFEAIGALLGGRDHSSITHYFKLHANLMDAEAKPDLESQAYRALCLYVYEKVK